MSKTAKHRAQVAHSPQSVILTVALGSSALCVAQKAAIISSGNPASLPAAQQNQSMPVREIDDPATGRRWVLLRDTYHTGGPGRLVQVDRELADREPERNQAGLAEGSPADWITASRAVIRAGDHVVAEENSPVVEVRLEAVALGAARSGETVRIRLRLGGEIISARAIGAGRVEIPPAGGQPIGETRP